MENVQQTRTCAKCGEQVPCEDLQGLCPSCVASVAFVLGAEAVAMPDPPEPRLRSFGDYELLEEIARGGMGVVYKARQISLNRIVAVKMILAGELASPADVQRFRTEAEAAASLQHPNIVAIHEVGQHEGRHYFSMDYVEGSNLAELVAERCVPAPPVTGHPSLPSSPVTRDSPLPWLERSAAYVKTIAEAIHYAHEHGTVHRDLKPSNILIDRFDQPRITDFGLAKRVKTDSDLTISGQIIGTPNFMAPEQAAGRRQEVGPQSDIYALGAILYFLITGRPPFQGETTHDTLNKVLHNEATTPRRLNPAVPRDLEVICLKCLEKLARRRYVSARALADDLGRFLNGEPIQARPIGGTEKLWRIARRHRLVTALSVALILLSVLAAVLVGHDFNGAQRSVQSGLDPVPVPEMPTNVAQGVSAVINGKIYVTSATDGNEGYRKSLYVYEQKPNSWKRLADSAWVHSDGAGGVVGGQLYLAGGESGAGPGNVLEVYDPASGHWSTKSPMPTARTDCAGVVLNSKFYVIGGYDGTNRLDTVESYDPLTGNWAAEPPMRTARGGCAAAVVNGTIYVLGGGGNGAGDASVEAWRPGVPWTKRTDLDLGVSHASVATDGNAIYLAGGTTSQGATAEMQIYEPRGNWSGPKHAMLEVRYQSSGAQFLGDRFYVFGGWDDLARHRVPHPDVFIYDPGQNSWRKSGPSKTSGH